MVRALLSIGLLLAGISQSQSLNPATVDSGHYKEQKSLGANVLRATFGPHEKSPLLSEPERFIVCLSWVNIRLTAQNGVYGEVMCKTGAVLRLQAGTHRVENMGDEAAEFLTIEANGSTKP